MRMSIGAHIKSYENCKLVCVLCNTSFNLYTFEHNCRGRTPDEDIKVKPSVNPTN